MLRFSSIKGKFLRRKNDSKYRDVAPLSSERFKGAVYWSSCQEPTIHQGFYKRKCGKFQNRFPVVAGL